MTATSVLIPQTAAVMTVTATAGSRHKCEIALFDLGTLDIFVQPTMLTADVVDAVASQLNLTEKQYFSLYFWDNQKNSRRHWLLSDQQLVEQDLPWRSVSGCSSDNGPYSTVFCVRLCFDVRYYAESVSYMKDGVAVELFYHSARLAVCEGRIECSSETAVELAAQALCVAFGNRTFSDLQAIAYLKKSRALSHPNLDTEQVAAPFEQRVLTISRSMSEQTRGESMVQYMSIVEKLPTYGVAYYEVTDAAGRPWYLGLCCHGMIVCDYQDRRALHRVFLWKHLENIYFRDRKFTIEIYDPKRVTHILSNFNPYENAIQEAAEEFDDLSDALCEPTTQVSISRRTFGPRSTNVYVWFTADAKLTKAIWTEAVCQHQFYLENRYNQTRQTKAMSEVAALIPPAPMLPAEVLPQQPAGQQLALLQTSSGLVADTNSMVPNGKSSQENGKPSVSMPAVDHFIEKQAKRRRKLSQKRDELREAVKVALQELRDVCLREAALTGTLPPEYPALPGELPPAVPRRVRTAFTISFDRDSKSELSREEREVKTLEVRYELQKQIAKATLKLVNDASLPSAVRKKHKAAYERLWGQVSELELELHRAVQRLATASSSSLRADLSSLSSGFSEDACVDVNDDLKSLSIHSFPLPSHHSSATNVGHFSKVASSPQLQQYLVDDRNSVGSSGKSSNTPPPPLMPRLSASCLTGSSQTGEAAAAQQQHHHHRRRHLSGSAAADRLSASSGGVAPNGTSILAAGIEQRSRSPVPTLVPRSSSAARLHSQQPLVQQPQTVRCPRRPPPLSSSLNVQQLRSLRSVDSAQQLSQAAADAWTQRPRQMAGGSRAEAAPPEHARPKRTGSCDDLLNVDDSRIVTAGGGFSVRHPYGSRDALNSSNPYGSLERRRPRRGADRLAFASASMLGASTAISNAAAATWSAEQQQCRTPWLPHDGHSQPASLASGDAHTVAHERLMRVQSSPLPMQLMEKAASAELGLSRRSTSSRARDGCDAAGTMRGETQAGNNSNGGRHTPSLLGSQSSTELPAEPPPLLPRASRRLSSGAGSGDKHVLITGPAATAASSDGQPVLPARLTGNSDPEQLYDAYALRLSKASQRMFESRLPLEEPPGLWPSAGAARLSSSASDQAGAGSSRAASHRPLGRRSAVPLPDADVMFEFGCTRSGSSRSGSSRSSSPGGGGSNTGGPGLSHSLELLGAAVMQSTEPAVGPDWSSRASTPSTWNQSQPPGRRIGQPEFGSAAAADCGLADPAGHPIRSLSRPLLQPRRSAESGHRGSNPVGSMTCLPLARSSLASNEDPAVVHGRHQLTSPASNHGLASMQRRGANVVGSIDGSLATITLQQTNVAWHGREDLEEPASNALAEDGRMISAHHVSTLV